MNRKKNNSEAETSRIVQSHDIHLDNEYVTWIAELKDRYRSAQTKAAVKVNAEKLMFNWQLGRDLVQKKAEERWGSGVVEQVSLDLKKAFPNADGFSTANLWFMKKWYLFYTQKSSSEKLYQAGREFPQQFAFVPWRHHVEIISKCKSVEEALFYIGKVIEQGMSRDALINCIKANLFKHQGKIKNNFTCNLPASQSSLVQEVLKENYDFGFATVSHEIYDENELENALTENVTNLLLEMGTGFAFVGRQKEILVGGHSRKIDLLFYHIRLRCYIACELKAKPFEPEFVGKLNFYVNAVDNLLKSSDDNPTIGLLICSDMNSTDVQWSFQGFGTPMGVATYNNIRIKDALPSKKQLEDRMQLLQKEIQQTKRLMSKNK